VLEDYGNLDVEELGADQAAHGKDYPAAQIRPISRPQIGQHLSVVDSDYEQARNEMRNETWSNRSSHLSSKHAEMASQVADADTYLAEYLLQCWRMLLGTAL
jgi:hypothetical protein